jgi:hypothetical protein
MQYLSSGLYVVMFVLALKAAGRLPHRDPGLWPAAALWGLVAVPSLLQFAFPAVYDVLHRDSALVRDGGQWWRPYTSFLVQDGGVSGTAFNLVTLAVVALVAMRVWGPRFTAGIWAGATVLYSVPVFLTPMEPGGGNSGLTFTLAASFAGLAVVAAPGWPSWLAAAAIAADGALVLALGDLHGVPMICGVAIGVGLGLARRRVSHVDNFGKIGKPAGDGRPRV